MSSSPVNINNAGDETNNLSSFKLMLEAEDVNDNSNWFLQDHNDHHENNLNLTFPPNSPSIFQNMDPTFGIETGFLPDQFGDLGSQTQIGVLNYGTGYGSPSFSGLRPLENLAAPTLFQKRAALRQYSGDANSAGGANLDDVDNMSFDGSGLNYDSDENTDNMGIKIGGGDTSNGNSTITGAGEDKKGKKKGAPAKNLMAERRRRKKLNDRLFMLRSVVPKISKMDRASILGDAIEYLKELLQKINELNNELESIPSSSSSMAPASATAFHPPTPTSATCIKEEVFPTAVLSPTGQPVRIEVKQREGVVNIHMFCSRKPGLLLSTMRTLENLGLDIQQAVVSCFNGFALDVFRAEQCNEGQDVHPDQIKAILLESAGYHGVV